MMTKKDYELIASAINETVQRYKGELGSVNDAVKRLAIAFAKDNPRFNRELFFKACGWGWDEN